MNDYRELYAKGKIVNGLYGFQGEYSTLSNFYELKTPIKIKLPFGSEFQKTYTFTSIESAFQASKTLNLNEIDNMVANCKTAGQFKRYGRRITLRPDWEDIKVKVMLHLVKLKAMNCEEFVKTLVSIPDDKIIVEMNYWGDVFWGVSNKTLKGNNTLGRILSKIRNDLIGGIL